MKFINVILFLLLAQFLRAHNPFWTRMDKKIIKEFVKIDKDSTHLMEKYFKSPKNSKNMTNLGFGWKVWAPSKSGGYISLSSEFYYFNDSLISFQIIGELPDEKLLRNRYLKWFNNYFKVSDENTLFPFFKNLSILYSPLAILKDSLNLEKLNNSLFSLMKPSPSLYYYWSGGYGNKISYDRKVFMENSDSLDYEKLIILTFSKNPITRFLAIEELIRKDYIRTKCTKENLEWIERCFKEIPLIETMNGCFVSTENSENLVYAYAQMDYR